MEWEYPFSRLTYVGQDEPARFVNTSFFSSLCFPSHLHFLVLPLFFFLLFLFLAIMLYPFSPPFLFSPSFASFFPSLFFHLTPLQDKRITMIIYVNKVNKKIAKRIIIGLYHLLLSLFRPQVSGFNFTLQRNQIRRWDKPKVFICCIIFISRSYPQGVLTLIFNFMVLTICFIWGIASPSDWLEPV